MDKPTRIALIKIHVSNLGDYSRADEIELLGEIGDFVESRIATAKARLGEAALSRTEQVELGKQRRKSATEPPKAD